MRCENKTYTALPVLPSHTTSLKSYVNFYFDSNQISRIKNATYYWAKMFSMKKNGLKSIGDNAFAQFSTLEVLDLSYNLLTELRKEMFAGLVSLKRLYLSNNRLSSIHPKGLTVFDTSSFSTLHLQFNKLKTLLEDAITWKNVTDLNLNNNPWRCDCHLKWMSGFLATRRHRDNVKCHSPDTLKGRLVTKVRHEEFSANCPSSNGSTMTTALGLGIVMIIVVIAVLLRLGFFAFKTYKKRKDQHNKYREVRNDVVYKDTVEPSQYKPGQWLLS